MPRMEVVVAVIKHLANKTETIHQQPKIKQLLHTIRSLLVNQPPNASKKMPPTQLPNKALRYTVHPHQRRQELTDTKGTHSIPYTRKLPPPLPAKSPLQALTAAALILPGLLQTTVYAADDDEVDFQYSHYQEGKRAVYGLLTNVNGVGKQSVKLPNNFKPIEVDSLHGGSRISLTDRIKFAFNYIQDTWAGATPIASAPSIAGANRASKTSFNKHVTVVGASPYVANSTFFYMDDKLNLYPMNLNTGAPQLAQKSTRLTHVLSTASPETRKQGDFKLGYEWDEAAVYVGGGISVEHDYESHFGNLGGRLDFNQKQTSVNLGLSYTNSDTFATLDPDAYSFINTSNYEQYNGTTYVPINGAAAWLENAYAANGSRTGAILHGNRQDWGSQLGLTQILSKNALLELGMTYTRSTGYMANPYKLVYVANRSLVLGQDPGQPSLAMAAGYLEKRPDERNQLNWNLGYKHFIEPFDAALHVNYQFAHDDWGINAHTFEADWVQPVGAGWSVTPQLRYYSQSSANFYAPYFVKVQVTDPNTGNNVNSPFNRSLPENYSSDQRLSGYGALSGGVTVAKQFTKGIGIEAGFEYYTHQGDLKLGGGGEQHFADYDYWVANAALKLNLDALGNRHGDSGEHVGHTHHAGLASPAGVMFDHVLPQSGDMMIGYRYMRSEQAGSMLLGSQNVDTDSVRLKGCDAQECMVLPNYMAMNMHMLDLMYAPTDQLTLMLMPQFMDMEMGLTHLVETSSAHNHGGSAHGHQTGGVGDTGIYALFKLFDNNTHHINLSVGGTAPTGDVTIKLRKTNTNQSYNTFIHYGMQLGSGTWDFKPSLTYTGKLNAFTWGAQVTGTKRLENHNESGFAFGDLFQTSVWGGYRWTNWLATTMRGVYTWQDAVQGHYPIINTSFRGFPYKPTHVGPFDSPTNYGGRFFDLGLGINVSIPNGAFAGHTLKFEWLQPLHTDYNGYQLDRDGALSFSWNYGF